jgi:electron transport complex protein RnfD
MNTALPTTHPVASALNVAASPHIGRTQSSTRIMMVDVLIALLPVVAVAWGRYGAAAGYRLVWTIAACLAAEAVFTRLRSRPLLLGDGSAAVTGCLLALSLPAGAPWYVLVVGSLAAIGFGKMVFGGLGYNLFNPAMVGRAFVTTAFPAQLGAGAFAVGMAADGWTGATPLGGFKQAGADFPVTGLLTGACDGSMGELSAFACLAGGLYLCLRRAAAWQIPAGMIVAGVAIGMVRFGITLDVPWTWIHELAAGAFLFGAFFIATDPVSSPITPKGRWIYGIGVGLLTCLLRTLSGYPEGVMFAVLLMNAMTPLINLMIIPHPVGGAPPAPSASGNA